MTMGIALLLGVSAVFLIAIFAAGYDTKDISKK